MTAYHQRKGKLHGNAKYTSTMVSSWRKQKKERNFSNEQLAAHLNMDYNYMMRLFQKDAHGELPI